MHLFLVGLTNLILIALILQLVATPEMEKVFIPLIKLAVALWILQFILQAAGHKLF
ncbi:hypothetical protein [Sporosarcina obsidiansis]|uniref:hypothetical protein n=1 Tax=Sporosarcina obsidiansis TaxID=2660748 RepID=UPI00129A6701|nr:hypothetical protein [Sporosarcina obsidiansis]